SFLNSGEVVKMHDRNQVIYRRSGWCGNRTTVNLIFSDAWNCLYERYVFFRIMPVKSGNVRRSLVHHYKLSHCFSPCPSKACHPKTNCRLAAIFGMRRSGGSPKICSLPRRAITLEPPKQPPRKLSKGELRQQTAAAFLAWRAGQTSKNK